MQSTMLLERSHWSDDNGKYRDEAQPFHYVHPSTPNPRISPPPHPLPPHPYRQRIQETYYQQVSQIASCARKLGGTPCTETKDDSAAKSVYCASAQTLEFRECFRKLIFQSFPSENQKKTLSGIDISQPTPSMSLGSVPSFSLENGLWTCPGLVSI